MKIRRAIKWIIWIYWLLILSLVVWWAWPRPGCGVSAPITESDWPSSESSAPIESADGHPARIEPSEPAAARLAASAPVGRYVARLGGTVRDKQGRPIAGAWVVAHVDRVRQGILTADCAGEEGRWEIESDSVGNLLLEVEARAPGFQSRRVRPRIQIDAGENPAIDLVLTEAPGLLGRVVDARSNRPIEGALVRDANTLEEWPECNARTDADGRFKLAGGLGPRVDVQVSGPGYASENGTWRASGEEQLVRLQPCDAWVSADVLEPDGSLQEYAEVYVCTQTRRDAEWERIGGILVRGFPAGPAFVMAQQERTSAVRAAWTMREVDLQPGENHLRLELTAIRTARIVGRVTRDGVPAIDAEILAARRAPGLVARGSFETSFTRTRVDGGFAVTGLVPGNYLVKLGDGLLGSPAAVEVELAEGETSGDLVFQCLAAATFEGKVKAPYPKGSLRLELWAPGADNPIASTVTKGLLQRFSLDAIPRDRYRLRVLDRGDLLTEVEVGPESDLDLKLLPER